jgi:hypothetical protein
MNTKKEMKTNKKFNNNPYNMKLKIKILSKTIFKH